MKCKDFLPALETGGFFRRLAARRHAARCPGCAKVLASWASLKGELSDAPAFTERERGLWTAVIPAGLEPARPRWIWQGVLGGAAAAAIVLAVFWLVQNRNGRPREDIVRDQPRPEIKIYAVTTNDIAEEVQPLEKSLADLDGELTKLFERAALADAKQQTEILLEQYRKN